MRRTWPLIIGVAAVGALAGVAIAGRPVTSDPFVLMVDSPTTIAPAETTTTTTTEPDTTTPTTTTGPTTTTTTSTPTTETDPLRERAEVRVVVANGSGLDGVAGSNADRLRFIGYSQTIATDALSRVEVTTIYYREGFEPEAIRLGDDLALFTPRFPFGDEAISLDDDQGDLIAVVGRDARR